MFLLLTQLPPHFQCKIKPEPNTQHLDTNSEDSLTDEDSPQRRIELTRRPSYNKIFTEISGPDITGNNKICCIFIIQIILTGIISLAFLFVIIIFIDILSCVIIKFYCVLHGWRKYIKSYK